MPRPFGWWSPALTINEYSARVPRVWDWTLWANWNVPALAYYNPHVMAKFKDPQHFRDVVDTCRRMSHTDRFFGHGWKYGSNSLLKGGCAIGFFMSFLVFITHRYYTVYVPANNPTWRKVMNKEWEEAINNSPWDHRSHVWMYCDVTGVTMGDVFAGGQKKFYIPV